MLVVGEAQRLARQHPAPRHEHVVIAVDQNVFNGRVGQQVFQGPKPRQFLGQRLGNLAHFAFVDRHAAQAHEAGDFDVDEFLNCRARPAAELGAQFLDTGKQVLVRRRLDFLKAVRRGKALVAVTAEFYGRCHDHVGFRRRPVNLAVNRRSCDGVRQAATWPASLPARRVCSLPR
ncbi:hypothetical protein D3C87_1579470 [compost metagenome]